MKAMRKFGFMPCAAFLAVALTVIAAFTPASASEPVLIELHRDPSGLTVMGRFNGLAMKQDFTGLLNGYLPQLEIKDLSGATAADPGSGWGLEMEIAARAAAALEDALVQIKPGQVRIKGTAPDEASRAALNASLEAAAGGSVVLDIAIHVPPRAIAPFEFSMEKTLGGFRMESCTVHNSDEHRLIRATLSQMGVPDVCIQGLGGPPENWASAILVGLDALDLLPAGRLHLTYHRLWLEAYAPARMKDMDAALSHLGDKLPDAFQVRSRFLGDDTAGGAPRDGLWVEIDWEPPVDSDFGRLRLRGRLSDRAERDAFILFVRALFPLAHLDNQLAVGGRIPSRDWFLSLQIAARALSDLKEGSVRISDGHIDLLGIAGRLELAGDLYRDLQTTLPEYKINTSIFVDLPALIDAIPLSQDACLTKMNRLVERRPIAFEQGEIRIDPSSNPILDDLVDVYHRCEPTRLRVTGFTDSLGPKETNLRLSQFRAEAVRDALALRGIPHMNVGAIGLGEASPIADNDTPEGRKRNRRIEFHPLDG